jgi:hypothetical protein
MLLNAFPRGLTLVVFLFTASCLGSVRSSDRPFPGSSDDGLHFTVNQNDHSQTSFGAEQPVQKIASLPSTVLEILRGDERNKSCLSTTGAQAYISASWFVASSVRLRLNRDSDLLVTSNNSCLNGANVAPFWIFRKQGARYELILKATGLVLDLLDTRTNHYRDIRLTSLSANREYISLYKFNGNSYVKSSSVAKRPRSKKKF